MISAVIVDDKTANIGTLNKLITVYCPQVKIVAAVTNIDSAYSSIIQLSPDLVFLDIEMRGGNGFELLRKFEHVSFAVIFTTAHSQYAVQAFRDNALDYLLKPLDIDALQQAVMKAERQLTAKDTNRKLELLLQNAPGTNKISIPVQDGYLFINSDDLVRCEGAGSYSFFFMKDGKKLTVSLRLKECEELLPPVSFLRVHKSHIVNLAYVSRYIRGRGGSILMQDGSIVDVAPDRKISFLETMRRHF